MRIALQTPEVLQWLQKGTPYRTELVWMYPNGPEWGTTGYRIKDIQGLNPAATYYPGARIGLGSPQVQIIDVAIDLAQGKSVHVKSFADFARHASGLKYLTDDEKTKLLKIASEAARITANDAYVTEFIWIGLIPKGGEATFEYNAVEVGIQESLWSPALKLYPGVVFRVGGYIREVAVDLTNGKVIVKHEYPAKTAPR